MELCEGCNLKASPDWCRNRTLPLHEADGAWKETGLERIGPVYRYKHWDMMTYERSFIKKPCLECIRGRECDLDREKYEKCPGVRGKDYILRAVYRYHTDGRVLCKWYSLGWINADEGREAVLAELNELADELCREEPE